MCRRTEQQRQRHHFHSFPFLSLLFVLLSLLIATTTTADQGENDGNIKIGKTQQQSAALSSSVSATATAANPLQIRFDPFRPSNEYRCGAFAEQRGPQKDPAMRLLHRAQNALIRALSVPFPHQRLLSDQALLGQPEAWKRSFLDHRDQWLQFARWWLLLALLLALVPPVFVLLYGCTRCCMCICRRRGSSSKKKAMLTYGAASGGNGATAAVDDTDERRWDGVKRLVLNALITLLIVANVFCAAVLLLSTQYAQHGLDELPTRLHYCANDLLVYRSDTAEQVRKLLRDDFARFNTTVQSALDATGLTVVQRFKQHTGIDQLEEAVQRAGRATAARARFAQLRPELARCLDARHSLQTRLLRLRHAREGLVQCERMAKSGDRAAACHQARKALNPLLELATNEEEEAGDIADAGGGGAAANWEAEDKPRELSALLPEQVPAALAQLEQIDLERHFAAPLEGLQLLQFSIQQVVDQRRGDVDERIRMLDRTLQTHYDQIGQAIKSVDLRFLDEQLLDPMMRQRERFRHFVHIGWLISLIVSGVFAFLALAFLLGLCFGCCGRRPSEYADDDCCVRSTGANFFGCSIWLSLFTITLFGILSALAMLLGATTAHLVCHPLQEPLSRPDMLSLADRLVTLYGLDKPNSGNGGANRLLPNQVFTANRRPADLIRGCAQGRTLYSMFEFDKKFTLLEQGGPTDEYEEMSNSIRQFLLSGKVLDSAISQGTNDGQNSSPFIQSSNNNNNFAARWQAFSSEMRTALEALGQVQVPEWDVETLKEFCAQKTRFQQLDTVIAELHTLQQSIQDQQPSQMTQTQSQMASTTETNEDNERSSSTSSARQQQHQIEELDSVLRFLEELRPDTVQVRALLEDGCAKLQHLRSDVLSTLQFNTSALLADLLRAERELGDAENELRRRLHAIAGEFATELAGLVRQYGAHINQSMSTEVSSCTPLAEIAHNTGAALCNYALDPLNSLWLALAVGLLLLLPTIVLASILNPLYRRTRAYTKYTMPSMHTADCYQQNEARFATDIYGIGTGYGTTTTAAAAANNKSGAIAANGSGAGGGGGHYQQPSMCTQITSPYAMSNYGYQELGPPIYMGTSRR